MNRFVAAFRSVALDRKIGPIAARKRLLRDLVLALAAFALILGGLFGYTRTWPPVATVSSGSMQHSDVESAFGVLDTGDIVLVQSVAAPGDVVPYLRGRASGYATYGDFGDVLAFEDPSEPIGSAGVYFHRAMAYVVWNGSAGAYDVPELAALPTADWEAWNATGAPSGEPYGLSRFLLHRAGWNQDQDIAVNLTLGERSLFYGVGTTGFLTMGDYNAYTTLSKVDRWVVAPDRVVGVARGEIPWFGLLRLTLLPDPNGCCVGWGSTDPDRGAPANSWVSLDITLAVLLAVPATAWLLWTYLGHHPETRARLRSLLGRMRFWHRARVAEGKGVQPATGESAAEVEKR